VLALQQTLYTHYSSCISGSTVCSHKHALFAAITAGNKGRGKEALPPMRERPDSYCKKFFVANVSFEAQDEDVIEFFAQAGAAAPEKVRVSIVERTVTATLTTYSHFDCAIGATRAISTVISSIALYCSWDHCKCVLRSMLSAVAVSRHTELCTL
jgi:hypothetical protein